MALTHPKELLARSTNSSHLLPLVTAASSSSARSLVSNGSFLSRLIGLTSRNNKTDGDNKSHSDEEEEEIEEVDIQSVAAAPRASKIFSSIFSINQEDIQGRSKKGSLLHKMMNPSGGKKGSSMLNNLPECDTADLVAIRMSERVSSDPPSSTTELSATECDQK